jgi:hypothetical protein
MKKIDEVSPPGWGGTTLAMKRKHPEIKNPWALAWSMKNKGYNSHYKNDPKGTKSKKKPVKKAEYKDEDKPKKRKTFREFLEEKGFKIDT